MKRKKSICKTWVLLKLLQLNTTLNNFDSFTVSLLTALYALHTVLYTLVFDLGFAHINKLSYISDWDKGMKQITHHEQMIDWTNKIICAYSRCLFSKKPLHLRCLLGFWIRFWFYPSLFHIASKIVFNKIKNFKWRKKYSFQYFLKKKMENLIQSPVLHSFAFAENDVLREKCPNTELFLVRIFLYSDQK